MGVDIYGDDLREDGPLGDAIFRDGQLTEEECAARGAARVFAQLGYDGALVTLHDLLGEEGLFSVARSVGGVLGVCTCDLAMDPDSPVGLHSAVEHERGSCGGVGGNPVPCGGCYDCLWAQHSYYERLRREG